jgi:mannose/cellobiose epimerase-like protein (N-acyl-D-glucosamine 2-epimerase family)
MSIIGQEYGLPAYRLFEVAYGQKEERAMKYFTENMTLMGTVRQIDVTQGSFEIECRSGDRFQIFVSTQTVFRVLKNLDGIDRDRVSIPQNFDPQNLSHKLDRYIKPNTLIAVQGIYQQYEDRKRFDARFVHLLHSKNGCYLFEDTHWWLTQTARLADQWLDSTFGERRTYRLDDFAELYRTNLNIVGLPTDDNIQEMATLARLIYGLSSAYLLTGSERYLLAASAGVNYQRETFRSLSHDGRHCIWAFGKRKGKYGTRLIVPSENSDDSGTIPLYEQIYALVGLAQYYRITGEWEVLEDIHRTVRTFNDFYLDDREKNPDFPGHGGYFSHLDYATMRPDVEALGDNRSRKNWNSIGDHLPAYLINLILALDPLPAGHCEDLAKFLEVCKRMLDTTSTLIVEKFPDPDPNIPYVNERFLADWTPDHSWRWQQNRAIVGHNLKIAWNLTRVANYYHYLGRKDQADKLMHLADRLGKSMAEYGIDQLRSGCFDAVERMPQNGMPVEFTWGSTKDFWQQEQAILAYQILHGYTRDEEYLKLARETAAFWNLFFLDHDNGGIFFRVTDGGLPYIQGSYGNKEGHSTGYHAFELNFLAHIYIRAYVLKEPGCDDSFCLYFKPDKQSGLRSINVLPDFFKPGDIEVAGISVNGVKRPVVAPNNFQIPLSESELGSEVVVTLCPRLGEKHGR